MLCARIYGDLLPLITVTVQTLAGTPGVKRKFCSWANKGKLEVGSFPLNRTRSVRLLAPWEDRRLWNFEVWSVAAQLAIRFIALQNPVDEEQFLEGMVDLEKQLPNDNGTVKVMVATLFRLKSIVWIWPLIFA